MPFQIERAIGLIYPLSRRCSTRAAQGVEHRRDRGAPVGATAHERGHVAARRGRRGMGVANALEAVTRERGDEGDADTGRGERVEDRRLVGGVGEPRFEAGGPARELSATAYCVPARPADPRFGFERGEVDRVLRRVVLREDEQERLAQQRCSSSPPAGAGMTSS